MKAVYPFVCHICCKGLYYNESSDEDSCITIEFAEFLGNLCVHCYEKRGNKNLLNEEYKRKAINR